MKRGVALGLVAVLLLLIPPVVLGGGVAGISIFGGSPPDCNALGQPVGNGEGADNNTEQAFQFLASRPELTREQAAAIVGNLMHEDGHEGRDDPLDPMQLNTAGSGAFGIAQWLGGRLRNLKLHKYQDFTWKDFEFQRDFLWWELKQDPASSGNALEVIRRTSSLREATIAFEQAFERSGDTASYDERYTNAQNVLKWFGDSAPADELTQGFCTDDGSIPFGGGDRSAEAVKKAADALDAMRLPYNYGGGHVTPAKPTGGQEGSYLGLDCSSSVSWVLQHAGFKIPTMTSGSFMTWGDPGPGKYVTVYANGGHVFMKIGRRYYGTSGFGHPSAGTGPAWFTKPVSAGYISGFTQVHPHGL
jgi:cell wall-associated NlpC family hydrolase